MKTLEATLGSRGSVQIPVEVRQYLKTKPHDKVLFHIYEDAIEVDTEPTLTLEEVFSSVTPVTPGEDLEAVIQEAKAAHYNDRFNHKHYP